MLVTGAQADCTCRALGRNFDLGGTACLTTPDGPRLAVCDMVLNNTSWKFSATPCLVSGPAAPPSTPRPLHRHARIDAAAPRSR
jgi:hypothetical protein